MNNNLDNNNVQGNVQNNGSIPTVNPVNPGNPQPVNSGSVPNNPVPTVPPVNSPVGGVSQPVNVPPVNPVNGPFRDVSQQPVDNNNVVPFVSPINGPFGSTSQQPNTISNSVSPTNGENTNADGSGKVNVEYTPPSKAKVAFLIIAFLILLVFVIFLPEITSLINLYKSGAYNQVEEKITTGKMKCSLKTNTSNLDKDYNLLFQFKDNKLEKTEFVITTKGDPSADEDVLDNLAAVCTQLEENLKEATGVYIRCDYSTGKLVEKQTFDLAVIDYETLNSAFVEAGGNYPEYQHGQDMDLVERSMKASGYTCSREK